MNLEASSDIMMTIMEKTDSNFEEIVNAKENVIRITISPEKMSLRSPETSTEVWNMDAKVLVQNYSNFKDSGCPDRVMYYEEDGSWVDYSPEVVELVRRCFLEKNPLVEVNQGGFHCLLDFCRMLEIEFDSGKGRSIAWIDVNRKCFFPKLFISHVKQSQKIDLDLKICENGGEIEEIKANRKGKPAESSNYLGKGFQIERNAMWPNTRLLNEAEKEQTYLQFKNFLQSMIRIAEPEATITRIHKCVRSKPLHKAKMEVFKNQSQVIMQKNGDPNMVFAWYGTSAQGVESILAHGFDMSNKFQCPQRYGDGVPFSPVKFPHHSAMMSEVDNNGEKHMILCRIILGKCGKLKDGSQQRLAYSKDFDSAVVDLKNTRYYVVWPGNINTHILPEAVVSYNPGSTLNGQLRGNLNRKVVPTGVSVGGLLSAIKKSLPQSKANELHALYCSYKGGRIGRDIFARRLRSLAGDERLRSIIREIHG